MSPTRVPREAKRSPAALRDESCDPPQIRDGYFLFWDGWPSNWHPSKFVVAGVAYRCVEQFFMAEKARFFGDEEVRRKILASPYAKAQKEFGRKVRGYDDARWALARVGIMLEGSMAKYGQDGRLRKLLQDTGDAVIVEASPEDDVWGIGLPASSPDATRPGRWRGQNLLGQVLMQVRETTALRGRRRGA